MDDAIADLLGRVAEIDEAEEEEEEETDKKDENRANENDAKVNNEDEYTENQQVEEDNQDKNEEIFMSKKIIKIDEDQAAIIRRNEIIQQVEIVSKEISNDPQDHQAENDDEDDEIDLDNFDIDWHYHTPSTK